jgi:adenylate cyclase
MGDVGGSDRAGGQPSRRLAAIMFTDLVGYSALAHRDEKLAIELLELHRGWVRDILPRHDGIEIETVGDAFLVEFTGALSAVECAIAIQQRFSEYNASAPPQRRMELRIGVHLGDIEHKDAKVMGDGVNIASRIHGMAEPGGICVSETIYHVVRNRADLRFKDLGAPAMKNISTRLQLYQLASEAERAAPAVAAVKPARAWRPTRLQAASVVAALTVASLTSGYWFTRPATAGEPSIAVLPFANMSADKDNEYFADGMHDMILTHLSRVKALKVISRTSVMRFRGEDRDVPEIARALGVAHIVEGSVQRAANRLRINVQLIEAATDKHLWAENYDRDIADVFAVQSEVAEHIVAAVRGSLAPQERRRMEQVPTANTEAYDLYLRAKALYLSSSSTPENRLTMQTLLERAVAKDPALALAHATLAHVHMDTYWFGTDPTVERRARAVAAVETALRLDAELPEAHTAMADVRYHGFRDYGGALAEIERVLAVQPSDAHAHAERAWILRRQGRWEDALEDLRRAQELDPGNPDVASSIGETLYYMHRYPESIAAYDRFDELFPEQLLGRLFSADSRFVSSGNLAPLRDVLAALPASFDPEGQVSLYRSYLALYEGREADAERYVRDCPCAWVSLSSASRYPKELELGRLYVFSRQERKARQSYQRAYELMQGELKRRPDDARTHLFIGEALAGIGRREEAVREAQRALELLPGSRDALINPEIRETAAWVYLLAGDQERALAELEQLRDLPGTHSMHRWRLSPAWKPLHANPRFQALIARQPART